MPTLSLFITDFTGLYDNQDNLIEIQIHKKEALKLERNNLLRQNNKYTSIRVLGVVGDPVIPIIQGTGRYKKLGIFMRKSQPARSSVYTFKTAKGITRKDVEAWRKYKRGV
ncbi:hypothetical protein [Enterococcus rivorum]|uniref:Uncharacterized protein n=1 Tax=Enterococcus rivorum TaxID=762845 RepID=A0A1E5L040_9ENTE|nr:hypothetical protein [Enterococcus rivorum]MBP2098797.1 hypothetical protein [Enterococcus rivorum]OEH83532.1 hypothetical protein BCR26_08610 [Enterococcus rivorum]